MRRIIANLLLGICFVISSVLITGCNDTSENASTETEPSEIVDTKTVSDSKREYDTLKEEKSAEDNTDTRVSLCFLSLLAYKLSSPYLSGF